MSEHHSMVNLMISVNDSMSVIKSSNDKQVKISDEIRSEILGTKLPDATNLARVTADDLVRRNEKLLKKLYD